MSSVEDIPTLEITEVTKCLSNQECPPVSILIPCYLRNKFLPLILVNLLHMDYPRDKIEVVILQDGPEDLFKPGEESFFRLKLGDIQMKYLYEKNIRRSIGEKRNRLVKMASHKICINMDSDDIYLPSYVRYSVSALKEHRVGITSSSSMVFIYPDKDYLLTGIRCGFKRQAHEGCSCFTKKHFKSMGGYICRGTEASMGEGSKMIDYNEKNMVNLDITRLMICVAHSGDDGNTVCKDRFSEATFDATLNELPHLEVLKAIFNRN